MSGNVIKFDQFLAFPKMARYSREVIVTEKIDGCVNSITLIWMADGSRKKVTQVSMGDEVMGVDENGCVVSTVVKNKFNNGPTNEWLRVEVAADKAGRGSAVRVLTVTPNHRFWCVNKSDYIRADELTTDDTVSVLRTDQELTPIQRSVMIGKMLGDGSLHIAESGSAAVTISQSKSDGAYIDWTLAALSGLSGRKILQGKSGYGTDMLRAGTVFRREIRELFVDWFSSGKKSIPSWVENEINPIVMAFWYMDDGSLGHHDGQEDRALFATNGFTVEDCNVLSRGLRRYGISAEIYISNGPCMRLNANDSEKFFLLIAPYIPPCMQRKLPERYRGHSGWMPGEKQYKQTTVTSKVSSIALAHPKTTIRYDIETGTHNYFASGILTHNSNAQISIGENGEFITGSRTRWITPSDDNYGFSRWAHANKDELLKLGPGRHFGEWWGSGIQRGYGLQNGEKRFSLFNTIRWNDETKPSCCSVVPVLWRGQFEDMDVREIMRQLLRHGSVAALGFPRPEGIVMFHTAGLVGFKKTFEADASGKGNRAS